MLSYSISTTVPNLHIMISHIFSVNFRGVYSWSGYFYRQRKEMTAINDTSPTDAAPKKAASMRGMAVFHRVEEDVRLLLVRGESLFHKQIIHVDPFLRIVVHPKLGKECPLGFNRFDCHILIHDE